MVDLVSQSRSLKFRCLNKVLTNTEELWSVHVRNLFFIPLDTVLKANMSFQMLKSCYCRRAVIPFSGEISLNSGTKFIFIQNRPF